MPRKPIIFTDLDGTLLNHHDYSFEAALPLIQTLHQAQVPIIPVTSKTRAEVAQLIQTLELATPFVVENGSGLFIPASYKGFDVPEGNVDQGYINVQLGCRYPEARQGLRQLSQALDLPLRGFGDFTVPELQGLTNLPEPDAQRAKMRDFSEPFLLPAQVTADTLNEAAQALGFRVLVGGRFGHLLGPNAGKGRAVTWLTQRYQQQSPEFEMATIGLGDSPNDLELLAAVNYPVIVPGKSGQPHPQLLAAGWPVANAMAPLGWVDGVRSCLSLIH